MSEIQQATLLVGPVYLLLYLLSGTASRQAYRISDLAGGEEGAAWRLWGGSVAIFGGLVFAAYYEVNGALITAFVLLHVLQNFWRPVLISRFDAHSSESQGATVLSIESQARRASTMVFAPVLGLAVDLVQAHQLGGAFWPIGALGLIVALGFLVTAPGRSKALSADVQEPADP